MRSFFGGSIIVLAAGLSGCAPLGTSAPSPQSAAFADRFPENMQGMIILKPQDASVTLDYAGSSWDGSAGTYSFRIDDSTKAPYVLMMLPPGKYTLKRLYNYNYWMDINKAVVVGSEGSFIGEL